MQAATTMYTTITTPVFVNL